jgi:hypothetical protein
MQVVNGSSPPATRSILGATVEDRSGATLVVAADRSERLLWVRLRSLDGDARLSRNCHYGKGFEVFT